MTLPLTLPLKLTDLHAEFSAPGGTPFSEFVKGGTYVPNNSENVNVPSALPLALTDFFGAAATVPTLVTIPPDPGNLVGAYYTIDGPHVVEEHTNNFPTVLADEQFAIDLKVRCNLEHVDGADMTPQLPGYSWARQRMNILMGIDIGSGSFAGVLVELYFTSATSGYIRVGFVDAALLEDPNTRRKPMATEQYQDQANTNYGNFVLPDGENILRLMLTRGDSGTTNYQGGGASRNACNYDLYIYQRDEWVSLWKNVTLRGDDFSGSSYAWDQGGTLVIGNSTYQNGAECDLQIIELAAITGTTVIP